MPLDKNAPGTQARRDYHPEWRASSGDDYGLSGGQQYHGSIDRKGAKGLSDCEAYRLHHDGIFSWELCGSKETPDVSSKYEANDSRAFSARAL